MIAGNKCFDRSLLLMCLMAAVMAPGAGALTITTVVGADAKAASHSPHRAVVAQLRRVDKDAELRAVELPVGQTTLLQLPDGTWEISVGEEKSAYWAAPLYVRDSDAVTVHLWPRGAAFGTVGSRAPATGTLVARFDASEDSHSVSGVVECAVADRRWRCSLPVTKLDLRFSLPGYATEFRWKVPVTEQGTDVGTLDLQPGSSVSGRVEVLARGTESVPNGVTISVGPADGNARLKKRAYSAVSDDRGFFQVRGLLPGRYVLRGDRGAYASDSRFIDIVGLTNASLRTPLVLAKPGRLRVSIRPAVDPDELQWRVVLLKRHDDSDDWDVIDQSLATRTGNWSNQRLLPGAYAVKVQQAGGAEWSREEITVTAGESDRALDITVDMSEVRGSVTLGGRPLAGATVRLGGTKAPAFLTDSKGEFRGQTLRIGEDETAVVVESETPNVRRTVTVRGHRSPEGEHVFDIALPATAIVGRTVNEDGTIEPNAIITLRSAGGDDLFEQMFSGADGMFQFEGFKEGKYALDAVAFQKSSNVVEVDAAADPQPIDLVLRSETTVRGRVTMAGVPVIGANVFAFPRDTRTSILPSARSDSAGLFVLSLPPNTNIYDVAVVPRGFYSTVARIVRDPKQKDLIVDVGQDGGALMIEAHDDGSTLVLRHGGGEYSPEWLAQKAGGTVSRGDGRRVVTIPNLESGTYSVCSGTQRCETVHVPRFATATVLLKSGK